MAMARHVFHAAVPPLREPALEIGLVLGELDSGNADLLEAELSRELVEPRAEARKFGNADRACQVPGSTRGRPV